MPDVPELHIDVLIFGGGIAGLWTLARLRKEGYSCLLLESNALGSGQTIASQGIIHGGIKYALTGQASAASKAIAEMPGIWRACLEGTGEVDLRGVKVLSERQYLWTTGGIGSRIAGLAASKVIRTTVESVPLAQRTDWLQGAPRGVDVYTVDEPVLDPYSLVSTLRGQVSDALLLADTDQEPAGFLVETESGTGIRLMLADGATSTIVARRIVLCAGAGNAPLLATLARWTVADRPALPTQQLRPLHMVMARGNLPPIFGHCIGMSDKPRITITSQRDALGRMVWYIGGQIAESGVTRAGGDQVREARQEVAACLPWIPIENSQWTNFRVDRAEGVLHSDGQRPDGPLVHSVAEAILTYPTKLAFAPLLAEKVLQSLRAHHIPTTAADGGMPANDRPAFNAPRPSIAPLPWDREDLTWT